LSPLKTEYSQKSVTKGLVNNPREPKARQNSESCR